VAFSTTNHAVGDQGQTHLQFFIDSDPTPYMFYNGATNEVLYNGLHTHFVHRKTATAFDIFGMAAGAHQVRLVLANASHTGLTNPEATKTLSLTVTAPPSGQMTLTPVATGLSFPVAMAVAPDGRIFYNEYFTGKVRVIDSNWTVRAQAFYQVSNLVTGGERGLLGIALDPNFSTNGYVYLYYTTVGPKNRVIRVKEVSGVGAQETVILDNLPASTNHNGGNLHFGPDGKLYITDGDAEQPNRAQDTTYLGGKILRLNGDGSIPSDNPVGGSPVYSRGLRNSFDFVFHPHTGQLWATENGPAANDEVNRIVRNGDYGWPTVEGIAGDSRFIDPIVSFTPTIAPTGIVAINETPVYPAEYHNNLLFADYNTGRLHRLVLSGPALTQLGSQSVAYNGGQGGLLDLIQAPDGYVYVSNSSGIFRVTVNASGGGSTTPPSTGGALCLPTQSCPPTIPTNVQASGITSTQATLTWSASIDNVAVTGYRIYSGATQIGTSSTTSYQVTGLTAATAYSFSVSAYDPANLDSGRSSALSIVTLPNSPGGGTTTPPPPPPDTTAPSVPAGLSASVISQSQINLTWSAATDNVAVTGYRVYRSGAQIGTSTTTSYSVTGLTPGTGYSFTVAAHDAAGNVSTQSGVASATTQTAADTAAPTVPGGLNAVAVSQTQINLAWNASTDNVGIAGYKVYRNGSQVATTAGTGFSSTGLTAGTSYSFTVAAYDAAGNTSGTSASASATTQAPPSPTPAPTTGRVIELVPSNADTSCNEEFETVANSLRAGDTLILHGGTYSQTCARVLANLHGTAQQPILIRAATGEHPVLTRPIRSNGDYDQNNLEIDSSSYVTIQGLTFKGGDVGIRLIGTNHHIALDSNEIAETGNAALTANSGDTDALTIRRNHIHHTGLFKLGATEGEGLYLGCNNATCRVTNSVVEFNYIHDLRGTSSGGNDGIEVKVGSGGNVLRHNVIHTTTVGTAFPCILVYGGGAAPNVVEGNAVWQCGEGIAALADAMVRNNVVLQSTTGLASYPHEQVATLQNVTFANNTVSGHAECAALRWAGATNMLFTNNALYCGGTMALYGTGLTGPSVVLKRNAVEGPLVGANVDGVRLLAGGAAALAFAAPTAMDFWPSSSSPLRGAADVASLPLTDFNGITRGASKDIGAFETKGLGQNFGWRVAPGFKVLAGDSLAPSQPKGLRMR
jgi:glucose/arabinose dehydrogenase/chitodextrinase